MSNAAAAISAIQSTAGAIPVRNEKGEVSMQKVKVHRYISGKRPDYAPDSSSDEEAGDEDFLQKQSKRLARLARGTGGDSEPEQEVDQDDQVEDNEQEIQDRRLKRLLRTREQASVEEGEESPRAKRHRVIEAPEIIEGSESEDEPMPGDKVILAEDSEEEIVEEDEDERERRRAAIRQKLLATTVPEEVLEREDDLKLEESSDESSEYEEYTDSEEEETGPRLKPVFVRKKDRLTVVEREKQYEKEKAAEIEAKRAAEERKRYSIKLVEEAVRKEAALRKSNEDGTKNLGDVCTDDENDELDYEAWKLRELKRVKRDKEEKEQAEKERSEVDRLRGMTEEQRRQELRARPKAVTNKALKGKYKFLQKYYHRGAFYLDQEDEVYKRDFSAATLEDHFDKSVLPKVMQVKNFGRSGRTKYTHLVDQDTTQFDSPWAQEGSMLNKAAGFKSSASGSAPTN